MDVGVVEVFDGAVRHGGGVVGVMMMMIWLLMNFAVYEVVRQVRRHGGKGCLFSTGLSKEVYPPIAASGFGPLILECDGTDAGVHS